MGRPGCSRGNSFRHADLQRLGTLTQRMKFKIGNRSRVSQATRDEAERMHKMALLFTQIVYGLSDDALRVAMDMLNEEKTADEAVDTLIKRMDIRVSEYKKQRSQAHCRANQVSR